MEQNFWGTCARCCEVIARVLLMKADVRLGRNLYLLQTKTAAQYEEMGRRLRTKALGTQVPWVGGMNVTDKQTYADNAAIVQPAFTRSMDTDPFVGALSSDSDNSDLPFGNQ